MTSNKVPKPGCVRINIPYFGDLHIAFCCASMSVFECVGNCREKHGGDDEAPRGVRGHGRRAAGVRVHRPAQPARVEVSPALQQQQ